MFGGCVQESLTPMSRPAALIDFILNPHHATHVPSTARPLGNVALNDRVTICVSSVLGAYVESDVTSYHAAKPRAASNARATPGMMSDTHTRTLTGSNSLSDVHLSS